MGNNILFVDDEREILSSLKRLFINDPYKVFTAESGFDALKLLEKEEIDVIVTDQRMPQMDGIEFLRRARVCSPDSIRIFFTGYADINNAIDSINKGEVYRYIAKPWHDDELKFTIHDAVELKKLKNENKNLLELTKKQNLCLKDLNKNLEQKVEAQTKKILKMFNELKTLYRKLDSSFINTVKVLVFSNMIRSREKTIGLHIKNTTKISISIAQKMRLSETEIKDIEIAALLHDLGKIGMRDGILNKPFSDMTTIERDEYIKHPILGQAMLMSIEKMKDVGLIIKHHHERWDGQGYPVNLIGNQIPIGSRIISVATDYDSLKRGSLMPSAFTSYDAKQFIVKNIGRRYDPEIAQLAIPIITAYEKEEGKTPGFRASSSGIRAGMFLARDLFTATGLLLMHEGQKITKRHINYIKIFERLDGKNFDIYVNSM